MDIYLVEVDAYDDDTSPAAVVTHRFSTGEGFTTKPSESPANTYYHPSVRNPGSYSTHLFARGRTRGLSTVGKGEIEISNADGEHDAAARHYFSGRTLTLRRGDSTAAYPSGFTTLFTGTVEQPEPAWSRIVFRMRDRLGELYDQPIQTTLYAGDNSLPSGVEGVAGDLKKRRKPLLYGVARNCLLPGVNTSRLIYQVSTAQIASVDAVRVRGAAVTANVARASLAALESNSPGAGKYDWYLGANGDGAFIRLGTSPDGDVNADVTQGAAASSRTVAQIVYAILTGPGGIDPYDIDTASVTALDTANSSEVGYWTGIDELTIGRVLEEILGSIGAFLAVRRDGTFFVGRLQAPSGTSVVTFSPPPGRETEAGPYAVIRIERLATQDADRGLIPWRVNVGHTRYWHQQTLADVAGIVASDLATAQQLGQEFRYVSASDDAIKNIIELLAPEITVNTLLVDATAAQTEATRLLNLYRVKRELLEITVPSSEADTIDLNNVITLQAPRYSWNAGKQFRVIGIDEDFARNITTLIAWG